MKIEKELEEIRKGIKYNTNLLEDLTLLMGNNTGAKTAVAGQMEMLKKMFAGLPIPPELKKGLDDIFDKAGGQ